MDAWQALAACEEFLRATLANAQIVDADGPRIAELQGALAELTLEQRAGLVTRMLDSEPSLPDFALAWLKQIRDNAVAESIALPQGGADSHLRTEAASDGSA